MTINLRKMWISLGVFSGIMFAYLAGVTLAYLTDLAAPWAVGIYLGLLFIAGEIFLGAIIVGLVHWWSRVQK